MAQNKTILMLALFFLAAIIMCYFMILNGIIDIKGLFVVVLIAAIFYAIMKLRLQQ